jgi:hypothetical protein
LSLYEPLFAAQVTIGTVALVFLPLVAQLAYDNKVFLQSGDFRWIKIDSVVIVVGIFLSTVEVYLENEPVSPQLVEAFHSVVPTWFPPLITVAVFGLSVATTFYTGYILLARITPR